MFALTMRGMQKSLIIGLLGALISTALAAVVGAFAGYFGGGLERRAADDRRSAAGAAGIPDHRDSVAGVPRQDAG